MKEGSKGIFKGVLISLITLICLAVGIVLTYMRFNEINLSDKWFFIGGGIIILVLTELWYLFFCLMKEEKDTWYEMKWISFVASFVGLIFSIVFCVLITAGAIKAFELFGRVDWYATSVFIVQLLYGSLFVGPVVFIYFYINKGLWDLFKPKKVKRGKK